MNLAKVFGFRISDIGLKTSLNPF